MQQSLLQRVAAGDRAAVRECIDRFGGLVWSLARRGGFSDAEAEDAVQEIFVELWRFADRYDPAVASEAAFVAMISRRRLIDRRRRLSRRPDQQALPESGPGAADAGFEGAQTSEEARRAARAMEQLAPDQQRVLRLSIMHGLSHEKIATALNMPLGTVKTHARRGLSRVREMLGAVARPAGGTNP
ncbi:MAG: sigma-70 family RNA polymerase sigma factor [Phycisphaerales bacterium]|nr:sigma-70 family RNA polymerase sigma factor [Phycisphaerales bacterium]